MTEFFRLNAEGGVIVVKRLNVTPEVRAVLTDAVSPHGYFDSLEALLEPHANAWQEISRGSKCEAGEAIERFALPNKTKNSATT
ncbi:MAG: hypothetical protein WC505_00345 [Patescibacteria group bacterium]